eukprot:g4476.t1
MEVPLSKKKAKRLAKLQRNRDPVIKAARKAKRAAAKKNKITKMLCNLRLECTLREDQNARIHLLPVLDLSPSPGRVRSTLKKCICAVAPYVHTFSCGIKERWVGRPLLEVLCENFSNGQGSIPEVYFPAAIESGEVFLDGIKASPDTLLRAGSRLSHSIIRREPPVWLSRNESSGNNIISVRWMGDVGVVNKPPGMPVHPTGVYRHNTVTFALARQLFQQTGTSPKLYPVHRLDRLTSGLLLVCRSKESATMLSQSLQFATKTSTNEMKAILSKETETSSKEKTWSRKKRYVARVVGKFPKEVICTEPIHSKVGKIRRFCHPDGKCAITVFRLLHFQEATSYNDKEGFSIIECFPQTGRTHQIRCHLHYLGHPIENDPLYGPGNIESFPYLDKQKVEYALKEFHSWQSEEIEKLKIRKKGKEKEKFLSLEKLDVGINFTKEQMWNMGIWLHAVSCEVNGQIYRVDLPDFAKILH